MGGSSLLERAVAVGQREAGRVDEPLQRAALDLAGIEQHVELAQSGPGVHALQVVLGAEQALSPGLALALGNRAEAVEAPGDGGREALLRLHVGGDRPEQGWLRLGSVGTSETLDGGVCLPPCFEQVMHPQPLIAGTEVGVITAPRPAGVAEHEDALVVVLERLRLGEIGRPGPTLHGEAPVAGTIHLGDNAS